jgi:hypothetical protein
MKPFIPREWIRMRKQPKMVVYGKEAPYNGTPDFLAKCITPPYSPGEVCYVPETWGSNMVKGYESYGKIFYRAGMPDQKTVPETYGCPWRSPVTMPQWAARRHVRIISCVPEQRGEWGWKMEWEESDAL